MAVEHLCTICSFTSSTLAGVESHMLKHTAEKRWKCDLCQKGHNTKLAMHTHRMTHTGERPNKCPTCGKGFIQSYHMIDHMRKDHNMVIEHKKKDKKPKTKGDLLNAQMFQAKHPKDSASAAYDELIKAELLKLDIRAETPEYDSTLFRKLSYPYCQLPIVNIQL